MSSKDPERLEEQRLVEQEEITNDGSTTVAGSRSPELIVQTEQSVSITGGSAALSHDLKVDSVFAGKYKILSRLGAGGMSVVYKAKDLAIGRQVAIKILREQQHLPDNKSLLRFQQEARATGALNHAGIVGVHEFAVSDDGQMFLVMDFVEGKPLSELIASEGHLAPEKCIDIALQVTDALTYAHSKSVVHRDLKPSNIMLVANESGSQSVKILDFGIAKITTPEAGQALTQTGEIFGSPLYMSPEQCSGVPADQRSDIYSLGCVLYEALVGRPPHLGDTALSTALMHLQAVPEELSSVRPDLAVPDNIETIVSRMLQKDASNRYQSMSELGSDLRLVASGREVPQKSLPKKRINSLLYWVGILLLCSSFFVTMLSTLCGLTLGNLKLQIFLQGGSLLVGFNLFLLSFVLCHESLVKKPSKPKSWTQKIVAECEAMPAAAARVEIRTWRRLALIVIVQLFVFGLALTWAQHPDRSLLDPLPQEELHSNSR